jgi:hypothetical protein
MSGGRALAGGSVEPCRSKPLASMVGAPSLGVLLLAGGCRGDAGKLDARTAEQGVRDSGAEHAGPRDGGDQDSPGRGALATAPIVDPNRGRRAVKSYLDFLARVCMSFDDAGARAAKLAKDLGLPDDTDPATICPVVPDAVKAVASGSFVESGSDEVLLEVPRGGDQASGESTLALMRAEGGGYRLIRHMLAGNQFEARQRFVVPGAPDVWMLCRRSGSQGIYRSVCGFFGQGSFRGGAGNEEAEDTNELVLVAVMTCGPSASVEIGGVSVEGGRLSVGLTLTEALRKPNGPDEAPGGFCSRLTHVKERRFTVAYEVDASGANRPGTARVRRVTPFPREVTELAARY